jgi:hypothetical protein
MKNELGLLMKISFFYEDIGFLTESQEMQRIVHAERVKLFKNLAPKLNLGATIARWFFFSLYVIVYNIYFASTTSNKYFQLFETEFYTFSFPNTCPAVSFKQGT